MWETILGGVLAIIGGWGAVWYQSRNARKRRMNELMADRKIEANAQAYSYTKEIQSHLLQSDTETTYQVILSKEKWFFVGWLWSPGHDRVAPGIAKRPQLRHDEHDEPAQPSPSTRNDYKRARERIEPQPNAR